MTIDDRDDQQPEGAGEFLLYQAEDGSSRLQVRLQEGTVWLSQKLMAELFGVTVPTINEHLRHIYEEGELAPEATIRNFLIVRPEGERQVRRAVEHYNLEAILAVGYRVRSHRGTQFRQWATALLKEYLVKGFAMDDERLKTGAAYGQDYFDELLERIRDIRASERRFYEKITDIYSECSVDYDPRTEAARTFFATVQNKLHWAIHQRTAAEIIAERANAEHPTMGLQTWKNAPHGKIRKADVGIAKNYLAEDERKYSRCRVVTLVVA